MSTNRPLSLIPGDGILIDEESLSLFAGALVHTVRDVADLATLYTDALMARAHDNEQDRDDLAHVLQPIRDFAADLELLANRTEDALDREAKAVLEARRKAQA